MIPWSKQCHIWRDAA